MAETEIELNIDIKKFDLLPRLILDGRSQGHSADMPMCIRPDSAEYSSVILVRFILNSVEQLHWGSMTKSIFLLSLFMEVYLMLQLCTSVDKHF